MAKQKFHFDLRTVVDYPAGLSKVFKAGHEYMIPVEFIPGLVERGRGRVVEIPRARIRRTSRAVPRTEDSDDSNDGDSEEKEE